MAYPRGTVLNARGEPITTEPRHLTAPLDQDLPTSEKRVQLADAPSPAWLRGIIENATRGRPREFIDFLDVARERDGRLDNSAQRLEGAVSSVDWAVLPADVDDDQKDRAAEIALDATQMFSRLEFLPSPGSDLGQGGAEDALLAMASAFYYGWFPPEVQWDYISRVGRWEPVRMAFRHPRRIAWDGSMRPRLYDPGATGPAGQWPGMELDPLRWLVVRGKVRPGYPTRDGLGRTAAWLYAFKRFSWKDFIQFSEQFGTPFILGIAGGGNADASHIIDDDTARVLKDVVRTIRARTRGVIDGRDRIDILWPQVSGKSVIPVEVIHQCDDEIAILFQGATQGVDIRDKGTYASAVVHAGVERDKVQRYARTISNALTFGLFRGWFRLNYPEAELGDELCPAFWMNADAPADLKEESETDRFLHDIGFPLLKSDIADRYGRPLPDEDAEEDDILERKAAPNPFAQAREEIEEEKKEATARPRAPLVLADEPEGFDEDEAGELLDGSITDYVEVADSAAYEARNVAMDTAEKWIRDQASDPGLGRFAEELSARMGVDYANVIGRAKFKPVIEGIYERFKLNTMGWPDGLSFDFGPEDILFKEKLAEIDSLYMSSYIENDAAQHSIKGFLKDWYGDRGGDLFKGRMKPETIRDFRDAMGGKLGKIHDWQAQRIINSGVVRVRGYSDIQQMMDASVAFMQWYATSAERVTCDICRSLHGTKVEVGKVYEHMLAEAELSPSEFIKHLKDRGPVTQDMLKTERGRREVFEVHGYQQPVHPNCRCAWLYLAAAAAAARVIPRRSALTMSQRWHDWHAGARLPR